MNANVSKFLRMGLAIAEAVVPGVAQVENAAKLLPSLKGKAKQDAVVDLVTGSLKATEFAINKDLLNDEDVLAATRAVIDAEVAVMNAKSALVHVVASKGAAVPADVPPVV